MLNFTIEFSADCGAKGRMLIHDFVFQHSGFLSLTDERNLWKLRADESTIVDCGPFGNLTVTRVAPVGYTEERALHVSIFDKVAPNGNWKEAIDATIAADVATEAEIRAAVAFFTGSVPTIEPTELAVTLRHPAGLVAFSGTVPAWRVRAAGYYATVGA